MSLLSGYNHNVTTFTWSDQTADEVFGVMVAPFGGMTVKAAYAIPTATVTASTANYYTLTLLDGGATGTATTAIGTAGGTGGWTDVTKATFTINTSLDNLDAGDCLMVQYDEEGTVAPGEVTLVIEWVHGEG